MTIAVTGASGHIGNNLCRALLERGHEIKVLINKTENSLTGLNLIKIYGSILDAEVVNQLIEGSDYVFHAAGIISIGNEPVKKVLEVNLKGTQNVVNACLKFSVKRLIHFSSIHALHCTNPKARLNETFPLAGVDDLTYDKSKAGGENIVLEACKKGLNAIILNPSSVIGPNDYVPSLIGQMLIKMAKGKLPFLIKGGYHFVDVRHVAETAINAMEMGQKGERYLLSSEWMSLIEIAKLICNETKKRKPVKIPNFIAWIGLPFISFYSRLLGQKPLYTKESLTIIAHSPKEVDNTKAINDLNFKPHRVEKTFYDAFEWFKSNKFI